MKNTIWSFALILITFLSLGERCAAQYTVNWHVLNQVTSVQVEEGKLLTIPENINTAYCDDSKVFVGWTNTPITEETDIVPATLLSVPPTEKVHADADYYAVFAEQKTTATPLIETNWLKSPIDYWTYGPDAVANTVNNYGVLFSSDGRYIISPDFYKYGYSAIKVCFKAGQVVEYLENVNPYISQHSMTISPFFPERYIIIDLIVLLWINVNSFIVSWRLCASVGVNSLYPIGLSLSISYQ